MNGFLVLIRCEIDDLPAGLFETEAEARNFAERLGDDEIEAAKTAMDVDASIYHSVAILPFVAGKPGDVLTVRSFEDEDEIN